MTSRWSLLFSLVFATVVAVFPTSAIAFPAGTGVKPGAVIYGVVPSLFGANAFRDTTARLDDLQRAGVDALWLAPIQSTDDPGAISYSITDYFAIRSDFGTEAEFRELVRQAHQRGMKVLLDFVPNHTSNGHPFFQDAQAKGKQSPYYDYYQRDEDGNPVNYFDWKHLPNLNFSSPVVIQMMKKAFHYWVDQFDVDGFRIDVAWGIRDRAPQFWPELIAELRAKKPGMIFLAEASARDSYYFQNDFDLAYDWTEQLGVWAWKDLFDQPATIGPKLHQAITAASPVSSPFQVVRFLNNNDTGKRFVTRYGVELTRVAAVLQHTLPGIPIVYMGDEIGAEYMPYENPQPIGTEDRFGLRPLYKRLAELREAMPAMSGSEWVPLLPLQNESTYSYVRTNGGKDPAWIILNFAQQSEVEFKIPTSSIQYFQTLLQGKSEGTVNVKNETDGQLIALKIDTQQSKVRLLAPATAGMILRL